MSRPTKSTLHPRGHIALALAQIGARLGFKIIPLIPGQKTPAITHWPNRGSNDPAQIRAWWIERDYNIGIVTGDLSPRITNGKTPSTPIGIPSSTTLVVVDYDCKPGQHGAEALRAHELLGLVDAPTAKTPHGIHKFFISDVPIPNSQGRIALNVDVRGIRGYVVAAGSIVDGVTYEWVEGWSFEDLDPPPFPEEFKRLALANSESTPKVSKLPAGELDRPAALVNATRYLINDAPAAIQGQHGDQTTFAVAARVKDLGVSEGECLQLMLAHWNEEKAVPPWAFDPLRTKVSNAYHYGQNAAGSADPANEFEAVNGSGGPAHAPEHAVASSGAAAGAIGAMPGAIPAPEQGELPILGRNVREPMVLESMAQAAAGARDAQARPLVEGILRQGELSVISGLPGSGKTFVALGLAHAIATGCNWNGMKTTPGAVLYVAAEGGPSVRARFLALEQKHGSAAAPLFLLRYPVDMRTGTFDAKRLIELVKTLEIQCRLIVIDTLSVALAGGNDTEHMQAYLYNAKLIQTTTGAHVLSVHHPGKDQAKGLRGHSTLRDMMDTILEVTSPARAGPAARRQLRVLKQRDGEVREEPLSFTLTPMKLGPNNDGVELTSCVVSWDLDKDLDELKASAEAEEVEKAARASPDQVELLAAMGRCAAATGAARDRLTARPLLAWLLKVEPDTELAKAGKANLRLRIFRLRESGLLMRIDDVDN